MFGMLFKQKSTAQKRYAQIAESLYSCALENTRKEVFYTKYGVPDSFDGRFDLLLLHVFLILHRLMPHAEYEVVSQALFDVMFKDMDQTLREIGIGDVGIPKHMKRMMKAFNGRMHNYQMAIAPETLDGQELEGLQTTSLEEALARNLYALQDGEDKAHKEFIDKMCSFVRQNTVSNDNNAEVEKLLEGRAVFVGPTAE